jgi:signal transduction histidine kinase/type II secretory pathway pseudopilin PulG
MFGRIRRLEISLAAKCQILFGAAVVLIIAAALLVPWQRMEQLTEQLDERAAAALADDAIARHIADHGGGGAAAPAPPSTGPSEETAEPDTAPDSGRFRTRNRWRILSGGNRNAAPDAEGGEARNGGENGDNPGAETDPAAGAARGEGSAGAKAAGKARGPLVRPPAARLLSTGTGRPLTRFDRRAFGHFSRQRDSDAYFVYERRDNVDQFRYAKPLYLTRSCVGCHGVDTGGRFILPGGSEATAVATGAAAGKTAKPRAATTRPQPDRLVGIVSVDTPSRVEANELLLNRVFILAAGLLAGTLAIATFYFITTRLILQPVRVLQETAEKVSEGDLNIRSDISTGDEFQQLSETFNTMLANLKRGADQLRSINKSLDLKLGQLAESNLALYESNRLKSEFLANVSHELRTPLNSILGFADLLKDALTEMLKPSIGPDGQPKLPDPKPVRYVTNILTSSKALLDLINDLLDLAKIEAGRMEIRSEPLSLSDLFEGLSNVLKPLSEQKHLTVVCTVGPDVPIIHSDPAKLQQVLYNFLSNAIKFSPPGARIDLAAAREADTEHVRVSVTDRGPGIDPDKQQLIFEKFRQLEPSHTRTHGGTGLGLAISKELTILLGGSIGVRSTPGEGSTFWVVLPLKIASGSMEMRGRLVLT